MSRRAAIFVQGVADRLNVQVYASMSWGSANTNLFNVDKWFFDDKNGSSYVYSESTYDRPKIYENSILNMGAWISATPGSPSGGVGLNIDTVGQLVFKPNGDFSTGSKPPFDSNKKVLDKLNSNRSETGN